VLLAVEKTEAARFHPPAGSNPQPQRIIEMVDGYLKATCRDNVIGAFRRAGIAAEWDRGRQAIRTKVVREGAENFRYWRFSKTQIAVEDEQ
jgi:hypothetical protein